MMNRGLFRHISISIFGLGLSFAAFASVTYVVKEGDKLSKIAGQAIKGPTWGKHGSLNQVLAMNPQIKDSNLIFPDEQIQLPGETVTQIENKITDIPATKQVCEPVRVPASEEVSKATPLPNDSSSGATLELSPYYSLSNITSSDKNTGNQANLASSVNVGVDIRYFQLWSENFRTFVHLKLGTLSFEAPTDSTKSLQGGSHFMSGIGVGGDLQLTDRLSLRIFGDDQKEAFARGLSTGNMTVDAVTIPEVGGKLSFDLFEKNDLKLGIAGQFSEAFQAVTSGYTASSGNIFGGALYLKQNFFGMPLYTEVGYYERKQNTNITNQSENNLMLQLRWVLSSGKKSQESGK